jgi:hypothetical protein
MRRRIILVIGMLGLAPPGCANPARRAEAGAKEQVTMEQELRRLAEQHDLMVTIRSGTEHFKSGQITLTLRGDGAAAVEQARSGERATFRARFAPERVAAIGGRLADHHFTAPRRSNMPREPGDTPLELVLTRAAAPRFQASLWYADRYDDADLNAIFELYDALVFEVTGGKWGVVIQFAEPTADSSQPTVLLRRDCELSAVGCQRSGSN